MGTLQRYAFGSSLLLAPLALLACGVVTADENGLFSSVASAPDNGAGGSGGGSVGVGGSGAGSQAGSPPVAQLIKGGDSCDAGSPFPITLNANQRVFRGTGDTVGDTSPIDNDSTCLADARVTVNGPDRVHAITVDAPDGGYVTARLVRATTKFDSVLYVRDSCNGATTFCEDAFDIQGANERKIVNGGDVLSFPVAASTTPKTFFLFVDGVGTEQGGAYDLEVSFAKGDCNDPIPLFIEPGASQVRVRVSNKTARNVMKFSCGVEGTVEVIYKVTRGAPGPLGAKVDSPGNNDLNLAVLDRTCDEKLTGLQSELECSGGPDAAVDQQWPGPQQSKYVAVDLGNPGLNRDLIEIVFDPNGISDDL